MAERACDGSEIQLAEIQIGRIVRGADQSLWGQRSLIISIQDMKRERRKQSDAPGPGVYWWHTAEDTFDKIDFDGLMRDGAVVRSLLCGLLNEEMLPADFSEYFHTWNGYLEPLKNSSKYGEEIEEIQKQLKAVIQLCVDLEKDGTHEEQEKGEPIHLEDHNRLCRITGGVISRLMHSSGSAYEQDTSFAYGPLRLA
ncbi:MAG: hypothetical protein ACLU48_01925 [Clostridiaceae bacterium]